MQCLHCGYMMSPLDKECERCRQRGFVPSATPGPTNMPPGPPAGFALPQAAPIPAMPVPPFSVPSGLLPVSPPAPGDGTYGPPPAQVPSAYRPPLNPYDPANAAFQPPPLALPARPASASALRHVPLLFVSLLGIALIVMALRFRMREAEEIGERTAQSINEDRAALRIEREAARPIVIVRPRPVIVTPSPPSEAVTQQLQQTQEQARQAQEQGQQLQQQVEELRRQQSRNPAAYDREQRENQIQRLLQIQAQERQIADQRFQQAQREYQMQMNLQRQQQERERLDNQRRLLELEQQNQQREQTPPPSAAPNGNP